MVKKLLAKRPSICIEMASSDISIIEISTVRSFGHIGISDKFFEFIVIGDKSFGYRSICQNKIQKYRDIERAKSKKNIKLCIYNDLDSIRMLSDVMVYLVILVV